MEKIKLIAAVDSALSKVKSIDGTLTVESAATNLGTIVSHDTPDYEVNAINQTMEELKAVESALTLESGNGYKDRLEALAKEFPSFKIDARESLTVESGAGSSIAPGLRASLLVNVGKSNQDAFTEEFFPSILTGEMNQVTIKYTLGAYIKDWREGSKSLLPIHETIIDTSFLQGNTLRLVPEFDVNSPYTNSNIKYTVQNGTKAIVTSPYRFGKEIDIVASVVDEINLHGQTNNIRTIAPNLRLDTIWFTNAEGGKTAAGAAIAYGSDDEIKFTFSPLNLADSTAMKTPNGKDEDFFIKFGSKRTFELPLSVITDGKGAVKFASYPNSKLVFKIEVYGDGNLTTSITSLAKPSFTIVGVKDANDRMLPADDAIVLAVMDALKDVTPAGGYSLETFEANGDVVNEGNLLTLDNDSRVEPIGYKQPLTIKGPIVNLFDKNTDIASLSQFITHSGDKCSVDGKTELLRTFEAVKNSTDGGKNIKGIGNQLIKPICVKDSLNIATIIRSMENTNLEGSLKASLLSAIKLVASKMAVASAYKATFERFYPNRKMRLSVGIDQRLQVWLPVGVYTVGPDFDIHVVSTFDKRFDNKIHLAFTSSAPDRNKDFDILGLGCCAYDTTVVAQVKKTIGGSTVECITAFPKYEHLVFCSVLGEIEVDGIEQVFLG